MAIFALITDLELLSPPVWYADFTERYLSRPKPHITLIQPRLISTKNEGLVLMRHLADELASYKSMFPVQDTAHGIKLFDDGTGFLIGINNPEIIRFQKALHDLMPQDLPFYNPAAREYERDFWPHLTMADQIPAGDLSGLIKQYDLDHLRLDVRVHTILCTLPPDFSLEESFKEENYHVMMP